MATTQHSDYYYNNASYHHYHHHHQSQQQQNYYGASSGQYDDCKNLNVHTANDAYSNYNYNLPNNYNNQWNHQHYNTIPNSTVPSHQHQHQQNHQQSHYLHHQHQQQQQQQHQHQQQQQHNLNMLNNQINDDYKNYSNNNITSKSIPDTIQHHQQPPTNVRNGEQPNLNCNQYIDRKDELFYVADVSAVSAVSTAAVAAASPSTVNLIATNKINEAISYPTSQLSSIESSKKRKIDNQTDEENDSPALRALLSNPSKKAKHYNSPYFYQSHGNLSPISSTDNYPQHYQLSTKPEEIMNLINYKPKDGFEQSFDELQTKKHLPMDGKYSAMSLLTPSSSSPAATNSPMSSFLDNCIATPPTSPKDTKHDDSSDNLTTWNDHQNGGKFIKQNMQTYITYIIVTMIYN